MSHSAHPDHSYEKTLRPKAHGHPHRQVSFSPSHPSNQSLEHMIRQKVIASLQGKTSGPFPAGRSVDGRFFFFMWWVGLWQPGKSWQPIWPPAQQGKHKLAFFLSLFFPFFPFSEFSVFKACSNYAVMFPSVFYLLEMERQGSSLPFAEQRMNIEELIVKMTA